MHNRAGIELIPLDTRPHQTTLLGLASNVSPSSDRTKPDLRWLSGRWPPWVCAALVTLFALPTLDDGWIADDHLHRARLIEPTTPSRWDRPFGIFDFARLDPAPRIRSGELPWWTSPDFSMSFFRPLSELSHALDYVLASESSFLARSHSLLAFLIMLLVVTRLFHRLDPIPSRANLASIIYTLASCHAMPLVWVANRSALLSVLWGALAVERHHHWQVTRKRGAAVAATLSCAASLLTGELGLSTIGFLLGYAIGNIDVPPWNRRLRALWPYGVLTLGWLTLYIAGEYGVRDSEIYANPVHRPLEFVKLAAERAPVLITALFTLIPADIYAFVPRSAHLPLWIGAASATVALYYGLIRPALGSAVGRIYATSLVLCLPPVLGTIPQDRLLIFVSIASSGLIAHFIHATITSAASGRTRGNVLIASVLALLHLAIAPIFLVYRMHTDPLWMKRFFDEPSFIIPRTGTRAVLFVNAPLPLNGWYYAATTTSERLVRAPAYSLFQGRVGVRLTRTSSHRLEIHSDSPVLEEGAELLFRTDDRPFVVGSTYDIGVAHVSVLSTDASGHPTGIAITFPEQTDLSQLDWIVWEGTGFRRLDLPVTGGSVTFAPVSLLSTESLERP